MESVEGSERTARYSFIGFDPIFDFKSKGNRVICNGVEENTGDPYELLREKFYRYAAGTVDFLPFSAGMVGYFSYDMVRYFESLPDDTDDGLNLPDSHLIIPSQILCFDHLSQKVYHVSHEPLDGLDEKLKGGSESVSELEIGEISSEMDKERYEKAVESAKEYIRCGDIYQTVLSRRKEISVEGDKFEIYKILRRINPSPYLFYLDFDETKVIGSSPEMLVRLEDGKLTTRPLAGTRKRSDDPEEDERNKVDMLLDEKERAEHVMLVDLHRNDMGRVSKYGTVKVDEFMGIEKYSHVQHIVSNVTSEIEDDKDCFDALRACFPAGTVSGAPKIRAMEIIDELEEERRGPYAGVVGYFDFSGDMDFAITIRTIFTKDDHAFIQAGAGIVADSVPEREYFETEHKMEAMLTAMEDGRDG